MSALASPEIETARKLFALKRAASLKVGSFVKPHIYTIRERVRIGGEPVSEELFAEGASIAFDACAETGIKLTFFELTFLIAALAFREAQVDVSIYEVGLGGRFDAVNVCRPFLSVITNVGADHQKYLGSTAGAQAMEKAGIVPGGGITVWGAQVAEESWEGDADSALASADSEIEKAADERKSALVRVRRSFQHVRYDYAREYQKVAIRMEDLSALYGRPVYENERVFTLNQLGTYQCANLDCVFFSVLSLAALGFVPGQSRFRSGVFKINYEGRFEILKRGERRVIVDAAHNADGLRNFASSLQMYLGPRFGYDAKKIKAPVIFACQKEKDASHLLAQIAPVASKIIAIRVDVLKPMPAEEIAAAARSIGLKAYAAKSPADAVSAADKLSSPWRGFVVCGSIYALGAVIGALKQAGYSRIKGA